VPETSITTQFHEPFDVHGNLSPKLPFNLVLVINDLADGANLVFRQRICVGTQIHARFVQYFR